MPLKRNRMSGLWEREVSGLPPKRFANAVVASQDFVHSLNIQKRLRKYRGCMNTIAFNADGGLLLSESDDRTLALWNREKAVSTFSFHTGRSNNVLHGQFMHLSDDWSIVSCAADGEIHPFSLVDPGRSPAQDITLLEMTCVRVSNEEKALVHSTMKLDELWRTSCYHLEEDALK